ncbi:Ppx/GppA phosphatase family protein [Dethiobacter alkaliphilus]|uniref:Ppx/GppA phosphatase n=1 Tax=Dethiobacter alkaliphilus AHT 1 TaxID=555088 RepID=C0GJ01_DETAL|nr:Ppx/GppA phosphatase family protein [Dethiobacter alkaliphilus]EEG76634.1 Ppx/GppA phosphatase [Dethiobacter alkaliphilus AHT 1]
MRHAAIDIGTNSVRLLVAEENGGAMQALDRQLQTTRLGSGLMSCGVLPVQGKERTQEAVAAFVLRAKELKAEKISIFATSALREAEDGAAFAVQLEEAINNSVEIISAQTEARYSYLGVIKSLGEQDRLVFDLGGGSCELIWPDGDSLAYLSLKIGAVYLTDVFFQQDPPDAGEVDKARRYITECLQKNSFDLKPLAGVGGTVTSLAAMAQKLAVYDPAKVHGYALTRAEIKSQLKKMLALPVAERGMLPGIRKDRAPILPAGTLVIDVLLDICQAESLTVSEGDILLGALYANASA